MSNTQWAIASVAVICVGVGVVYGIVYVYPRFRYRKLRRMAQQTDRAKMNEVLSGSRLSAEQLGSQTHRSGKYLSRDMPDGNMFINRGVLDRIGCGADISPVTSAAVYDSPSPHHGSSSGHHGHSSHHHDNGTTHSHHDSGSSSYSDGGSSFSGGDGGGGSF